MMPDPLAPRPVFDIIRSGHSYKSSQMVKEFGTSQGLMRKQIMSAKVEIQKEREGHKMREFQVRCRDSYGRPRESTRYAPMTADPFHYPETAVGVAYDA